MTTPLKLLLVEDSADDADLLMMHLRQGGYDVDVERVETAKQLTTALSSSDWELVISDYNLPEFDGIQALKIVNNDPRDIPFIIISGNIGEDKAAAAVVEGAKDYVLKDNLARLIPAIGRELKAVEARNRQLRNQQIIDRLLVSVADVTGVDFFNALTECVATVLNMRHVHIAKIVDFESLQLKTLSIFNSGKHLDNTEYSAEHTPCKEVVHGGFIFIPNMDPGRYVKLKEMTGFDVEAYIGLPLKTAAGSVIGILAAVCDGPFDYKENIESAFYFIAARAAAEIEREDVEERLLASEHELRGILDNIQDAIYRTDKDGYIIYASAAVEALLGYKADELIGTKLANLYFDESGRNQFLQEMQNNNDSITNYEAQLRRKDGSMVWVSTNAHYYRDDATGAVLGIEGISRNVTAAKLNEKALEVSREHLEELVEQRTSELSDAIGKLEIENNERRRIEMALVDATRRAELANKAKTEFLANMSHELRTPLNSIIGFAELLMLESEDVIGSEQREKLQYILDSGWHLLSLINDILDLSRIEAGKSIYEPAEVSAAELLDRTLAMFREKADKGGLRIISHIDDGADHIFADERKLKQILFNLVSNAIKFTEAGGQISIHVQHVDLAEFEQHCRTTAVDPCITDFTRISVSDTGIGISQKGLAQLFQPFQQLDAAITRRYEGSGLGLHLCKQLVELHAGCIWAESEVGVGTTFNFIIPSGSPVK